MKSHFYNYVFVVVGFVIHGPVMAALANYDGSTLPPSPWQMISTGPVAETSQHSVSSNGDSLRMTDTALLTGNTLGYLQHLDLDSNQNIRVEFRARVFSGESVFGNEAPFDVWIYDGLVRADIAVGPNSVTALGPSGTLFDSPISGDQWHTYAYTLTPAKISWYIDGLPFDQAIRNDLIQHATTVDRRVNMFISSAAADVELDYLIVDQTPVPIPGALLLLVSGIVPLAFRTKVLNKRV